METTNGNVITKPPIDRFTSVDGVKINPFPESGTQGLEVYVSSELVFALKMIGTECKFSLSPQAAQQMAEWILQKLNQGDFFLAE